MALQFIHPTTGLRILIKEVREYEVVTDIYGVTRKHVVCTRLETEAGQECTPATAADHHELLQVDVHVGKSQSVRLVREFT